VSPRAGTVVLASFVLAGCSYHNVVFNAERLYAEGEAHRRRGEDSLAVARYTDVVRKTGEAVRARADADWAHDALFLLGRSHLRLGDLSAARGALLEAASSAPDDARRGQVLVYLAAVQAEVGDQAGALDAVASAFARPLSGASLAEAHLVRGRLLLERGYADQGWWDLDRAVEADPGARAEAGLERLRWSIIQGDRDRARLALDGLLAGAGGASRLASITTLVDAARDRWSAARAAALLVAVDSSSWDGVALGRIRLHRARLLDEAGDTAAAAAEATRVASGLGPAAAEARLLLSSWQGERVADLFDVHGLRASLLPAGADSRVAQRLAAIDELQRLTSVGMENPLAWFAAAEVARERLGADYLARGLYLAYASGSPNDPWVPKALLAALQSSRDEGDRAWIRGRLEAHADSPYVLAAGGGYAAGLDALEEDLAVRLRELTRQ
jgi:tetratricopeptide (TPR) repeat protein